MKQVLLSLCALAVAVGIFAGMVLYTVSVIRDYEQYILLGDETYTLIHR